MPTRPSLAVLLLIATTAVAQDKPDFSGRWVLAYPPDAAPDIAQTLTVTQTVVRTDVNGKPIGPFFSELIVEKQLASGVRSEAHKIGIEGGIVGGKDANGVSHETRFSVRWIDRALVIENGSYSGPTRESGPFWEHMEVWSFDADGRLVISMTEQSSDAEPVKRTLIYRKSQPQALLRRYQRLTKQQIPGPSLSTFSLLPSPLRSRWTLNTASLTHHGSSTSPSKPRFRSFGTISS